MAVNIRKILIDNGLKLNARKFPVFPGPAGTSGFFHLPRCPRCPLYFHSYNESVNLRGSRLLNPLQIVFFFFSLIATSDAVSAFPVLRGWCCCGGQGRRGRGVHPPELVCSCEQRAETPRVRRVRGQGPPPGPAGSRLVAVVLPIVVCCPTAQRGAGAAVQRPSRAGPCGAAPSSPAEPAAPPAPPERPGSPGDSRGAEVGGGRAGKGRGSGQKGGIAGGTSGEILAEG